MGGPVIAELRVVASAWLGWLSDAAAPTMSTAATRWAPIPHGWSLSPHDDFPLGEYPPIVPAAAAPSVGGGHPAVMATSRLLTTAADQLGGDVMGLRAALRDRAAEFASHGD